MLLRRMRGSDSALPRFLEVRSFCVVLSVFPRLGYPIAPYIPNLLSRHPPRVPPSCAQGLQNSTAM